jgi:endothelin-converting enzyme
MDKDTTKKAVEKVHNIVQKIGYPTKSPDIMDPTTLKNYYESINVSSNAFFANAMAMRRFAVDNEWSALGKPVDRDQWDISVPTGKSHS